MRRFAQICCLLAAFAVAGGHWAVLQSVAWFGMLADYSAQYGLVAGAARTFDGQHPCSLCDKVNEGRKKEERQIPLLKLEKSGLAAAPAVSVPPARPAASVPRILSRSTSWSSCLPGDVPVPPPRRAV